MLRFIHHDTTHIKFSMKILNISLLRSCARGAGCMRLVHDLAELSQMVIIMIQTHDKARNGIVGTEAW